MNTIINGDTIANEIHLIKTNIPWYKKLINLFEQIELS